MKYLSAASGLLFLVAMLFRLLHYPGGGLLLVMSSLIFLWFIAWFALRQRNHMADMLVAIAAALLTVTVYSRLQFLEPPWSIVPVAAILLLAAYALLVVRRMSFRPLYLVTALLCFLGAWLTYTPTSGIHYFFRLNATLQAESRKTDYRSWDRYSWLLYHEGKHGQALTANGEAWTALNEAKKADMGTDAYYFTKMVEDHERRIRENNWTSYP